MFKTVAVLLITASLLCAPCYVHPEILPPDRSIDWTDTGIPGGIPDVPVGVDVKKDLGALGDGQTDDAPVLQKAIETCPEGKAVLIPAGTYLLRSPLKIEKGIVLRGAGKDQTMLLFDLPGAPAQNAISIITYHQGEWQSVLEGLRKGSRKLRVKDGRNYQAGGFAEIEQENDPAVMYTRPEWKQDWAEGAVGQILKIRKVEGELLLLEAPLNITFDQKLKPRIRPQGLVQRAGLEQLHLKRLDTGDGDMVHLKNAAYCWVRDVESEYVFRCHVTFDTSLGCEVRDSSFHHAHDYGGGGHGYGVEMNHHTTGSLVEGNRFNHLRHAMLVQVGANGNVYAHNVSTDPYSTDDQGRPFSTPLCDISLHGHYTFMNLFEGNSVQFINIGDFWGPAGPGNTFLNNVVEGAQGIVVNDHSNGQNFIGNKVLKGQIVFRDGTDPKTILLIGNEVKGKLQGKIGQKIPETLHKTGGH